MTKKGLDMKTISTKRTHKQANCVFLLEQVTIEKGNAPLSQFLKFHFACLTNGTFGYARNTSQHFAKPKELLYLIND